MIELAISLPRNDSRYIFQQRAGVAGRHHWQMSQTLRRLHLILRHQDFHPIWNPTLRVDPKIRHDQRRRGSCTRQRGSHLIDGHSKLARTHAIYIDVEGWIVEGLSNLDIAQGFCLTQLPLDLLGERTSLSHVVPRYRDFYRRRRSEVEHLRDDIARLKREPDSGESRGELVSQPRFEFRGGHSAT